MKRAKIAIFLLFNQCLAVAIQGQVNDVKKVCSSYTFNTRQGNWEGAMDGCIRDGGSLVSMETEDEWNHVKQLAKGEKGKRWFIGLRKGSKSEKWCWLSDNTNCINETSSIHSSWRWVDGEPNKLDKEKCVEMWKNGKYNNVECVKEGSYDDKPGYICENPANCTDDSKGGVYMWTTIITATPQPFTTGETFSASPEKQSTITRPDIQLSTIVKVQEEKTYGANAESSTSLVMILIIILAVVLGILLIVLVYVVLRKKLVKKEEIESQCGNLESSGEDVQTAGQNSRGQASCHRNTIDMPSDEFCTQTEALEMVHMEQNYAAVIRNPKTNSTQTTTGISATPQHYLVTNEEIVYSEAYPPFNGSLKGDNRVYANVKKGSSKKGKSGGPSPSVEAAKKPEENTDHIDDRHSYLYAVVDKNRKRKQNDEVGFGPVYAELDFA